MFNKLFKFLKGYVIILISGRNTERFMNICLRRGIEIWGIDFSENSVRLCISKKDFFRIKSIAYKTRTRVKIIHKCGLCNFISRYRKRYILIVGFFLTMLFIAVSSQFIWIVEINGVYDADIYRIIETLKKNGVYSGSLKRELPKGYDIKREILTNCPDVSWAWVYIEGVKARIEINEKIIAPKTIDDDTPCDIRASCDALITKMTVKNGEALIKAGDTVSAGDILISGRVPVFMEGYPEKYMSVHSEGIVEAQTHRRKCGSYEMYYETKIPGNKKKTYASLELFGKKYDLFKDKNIPFDDYIAENERHEMTLPYLGYLGICINTEKYTEAQTKRQPIPVETAVEFAKSDLEKKIAGELTLGAKKTWENITYTENGDKVDVELEMEFIENIGAKTPLEETGEAAKEVTEE